MGGEIKDASLTRVRVTLIIYFSRHTRELQEMKRKEHKEDMHMHYTKNSLLTHPADEVVLMLRPASLI
jgi:hypothetical protein